MRRRERRKGIATSVSSTRTRRPHEQAAYSVESREELGRREWLDGVTRGRVE